MNTQQYSSYANHDEIWLLLPWYVNGSLQEFEREQVKAHVRVCLTCRRELAHQAMLAKHLEHTPRVEISSKPSFDRLMSRLQEEEAIKPSRVFPPSPKAIQSVNWKQAFMDWLAPKHLTAAFATGLLAVAVVSLISNMPSSPTQTYHTVAEPNSLDRFKPNDIRVVFAEQVSDREIRRLLDSAHGSIVDGPNPAGVYTVRISSDQGNPAALDQVLSQLRGDKIVIFAEPALPQVNKPKHGGG